jgi:peptide/nickel transport system substrate-binding protein
LEDIVRAHLTKWRWLALLAVFALVAAACGDDTGDTTTTTAAGETTTTVAEETTTTAGEPVTGFSYRTGIFQDTTTDNYWSYLDTNSTVWNQYLLAPTKATLFEIKAPGLEVGADIAAVEEVPLPVEEGGAWTITVPMKPDAVWSDGSPLTADDVVFTAEAVRDLGLGGNWLTSFPWAAEDDPETADVDESATTGLTAVEAVDANTVKFTFNNRPGLGIWPHQVGIAPVMSKAFWEAAVEEAKGSEDPAAALYAASGAGDLSAGPTVFDSRQEGAFSRTVANPQYFRFREVIRSGEDEYELGPFISEVVLSLYGDQSAAVLALKAGEVDYLFNPLGLQRGLADQVIGDENLTAVVNPTYGFRYLAFNLRRDITGSQAFRDALALMIDKEFVASSVLQNVAFPLYSTMPEGNVKWYNEEVDGEFRAQFVGKSTEERLNEAIAILTEGGFAWETPPVFENNAVTYGTGVTFNGAPVGELEILSPGPGYDPLRATYSIWIETWLNQLGFDAKANPTDFNTIVQKVFVPDDAGELDFDMFILGWSLGNPAFPGYHESFWAGKNDTLVNDGNNNTGFNDPDFNALVDEYNAAQTEEEAYDILWEMERILFEQKPYILLFDTGILEAYRSANIDYPFTNTLSGIQFLAGAPGLVTAAR